MPSKAVKRARPRASVGSIEAVTEQLRAYATRGVFREFTVKESRQAAEYRINWLTPRPLRVRFDAKSSLLTLVDLLPDISPRSPMDLALRVFVAGRFSTKLPEHRRISKQLVRKLVVVNSNRKTSLRLTLNKKDTGAGARQALLLISEIFQNFLAGPYHEYMVRNFDLRED
ncbi:MAG TPA: hypothetical protein VK629_13310 [Steroidobacteraceae bacterium]|nr:hypothetical protein [Steroidobacteraceae bacterium]